LALNFPSSHALHNSTHMHQLSSPSSGFSQRAATLATKGKSVFRGPDFSKMQSRGQITSPSSWHIIG
jgi:hypothetical protein